MEEIETYLNETYEKNGSFDRIWKLGTLGQFVSLLSSGEILVFNNGPVYHGPADLEKLKEILKQNNLLKHV